MNDGTRGGERGQPPNARSPHPATVAQPKAPHPATVAQPKAPRPTTVGPEETRPPHPATVVQRKEPHPATAQATGISHPATVQQARRSLKQEANLTRKDLLDRSRERLDKSRKVKKEKLLDDLRKRPRQFQLKEIELKALESVRGCLKGKDNDLGDEACWNWALTGVTVSLVKPPALCDYITGYGSLDVPDNDGKHWMQWNKEALLDLKKKWESSQEIINKSDRLKAEQVVREAMMKMVIEANDLITSTDQTDYAIFAYYEPGKGIYPDHWWIDVRGTCIELFPKMKDIQIYRGWQKTEGVQRMSFHVTGLHLKQIERISKILQEN